MVSWSGSFEGTLKRPTNRRESPGRTCWFSWKDDSTTWSIDWASRILETKRECLFDRTTSTNPGDVIEVRDKSRKVTRVQEAMESAARREVPSWLELDKTRFTGTVRALPMREELTMPIQEQLIVELYSK
jgi:hypothetical protein